MLSCFPKLHPLRKISPKHYPMSHFEFGKKRQFVVKGYELQKRKPGYHDAISAKIIRKTSDK